MKISVRLIYSLYMFHLVFNIAHAAKFNGIIAPAVGFDELPYIESDNTPYASLIVMGRSGSLFFEGNRIGYLFERTDFGAFSWIAQSRSHQYLPFDQDNKAVEIGAQFASPIAKGWFSQLTFFTDVSRTHSGQEFEASVYRRDAIGELTVLSMFAVQKQSKNLTSYYSNSGKYTVSNGDFNAELELIFVYPLTEDLRLLSVYRHYLHGSGIEHSPLTQGKVTSRLLLGLGWAF